jgi:hypothetical protein
MSRLKYSHPFYRHVVSEAGVRLFYKVILWYISQFPCTVSEVYRSSYPHECLSCRVPRRNWAMTVFSPRGREGIYREILPVSESVPAWIRRFEVVTFRSDLLVLAAPRGR